MKKSKFGSLEDLRLGLPRYARNDNNSRSVLLRRQGFTLAEVLITLAIIGVVAAMTIPTLITKMNQRAAEARQKTIEARLLDGINRYSTLEDGLSKPYETTYDFLVGLSKHYKMAQICKADEITKCIPYSTITYTADGEDATVEVANLTSIDSFMSEGKEDYLAPASFITAQGTPVIMAFKKDCAWDTGKAMRSIQDSGCIAYMYDESGTRNPNKLGKDIIAHGLTIVPPSSAPAEIATVGGYKIMEKAFFPPSQGLTSVECSEEISKNYGITVCPSEDDRWAYAMKYCHDKGWRLPDETESLAIVNGLFKDSNGNHPSGTSWDSGTYKIDLDLVSTLDLKNHQSFSITKDNVNVSLWGSVEHSNSVQYRYFNTEVTVWRYYNRNDDLRQVLCISD